MICGQSCTVCCERDGRFSRDAVLRAELEQVYRQHRQALFSLALNITGCSGLAEDAVHEAFVRLCGRQEQPSGRLAAYVFAAVRNVALDCLRGVKRDQKIAESIFAQTVPSCTSANVAYNSAEELAERLMREIERLDGNVREIILMKIYGELTFDEIGNILRIPAATVATRYRRALTAIEKKLRRDL